MLKNHHYIGKRRNVACSDEKGERMEEIICYSARVMVASPELDANFSGSPSGVFS